MDIRKHLAGGDALLIVDVQNDFCPGGELALNDGDGVVPVLNASIEAARDMDLPVYASRDWHPERHVSFRKQGGEWPPHCLQDTRGAGFHPSLKLPPDVVKITKGVRFDKDQNSAFDETGLARQLRRDSVHRLWVGGLARDVCVLATVLDARKAGFDVVLIEPATRAVSTAKGLEAIKAMAEAGAKIMK
jgi:nicotinamidase/pyrazinamidase